MGKYSSSGMGAAQRIFNVGHIPLGTTSGRRVSDPVRLRAVRAYVAEYGLDLKVGPLRYKIIEKKAFFSDLKTALGRGDRIAKNILGRMYRTARYYRGAGLYVTVKEKKAVERRNAAVLSA